MGITRSRIQRPSTPSTKPTRAFSGPFALPKRLISKGREARHPLPSAGGMLVLRTLWERPAGTQNTLAPNGGKLGQLRHARQGLVRVPKSNTKYGGKGRITGGNAAPVIEPSIGESSGNPKRKKSCLHCGRTLHPAVHRGGIFCRAGLLSETHVALRETTDRHVREPVVGGRIAGMLPPIPPIAELHDRIKTTARCASRARRTDVPRHHLGGLGVQLARDEIPAWRIAAADFARLTGVVGAVCWPRWRSARAEPERRREICGRG